jgi:hypothetical protein
MFRWGGRSKRLHELNQHTPCVLCITGARTKVRRGMKRIHSESESGDEGRDAKRPKRDLAPFRAFEVKAAMFLVDGEERHALTQKQLQRYPESTLAQMMSDTAGADVKDDGTVAIVRMPEGLEGCAAHIVACYTVGVLEIARPPGMSASKWNLALRHFGIAPHDLPPDVPTVEALVARHETRWCRLANLHIEWLKSVMGECLHAASVSTSMDDAAFRDTNCIHLWVAYGGVQCARARPNIWNRPYGRKAEEKRRGRGDHRLPGSSVADNVYEFTGTDPWFAGLHDMVRMASPVEIARTYEDFVEHCKTTMGYRVSVYVRADIPFRSEVLCTTIRWGETPAQQGCGCIVC